MTRAILTFFFRLVVRNKLNFAIKSAGILISLTTVLLVLLYVTDELAYDRFHTDADRLFRLTTTSEYNGNVNTYSRTPLPLAPHLAGLKTVEHAARVYERSASVSLANSDAKINEDNIWFADSSITHVFAFEVLEGSVSNALTQKHDAILSRTAALKYFGDVDAVGKELTLENNLTLSVIAVVEDFPVQSSFRFQMIVPFDLYFQLENPSNVDYLRSDWIYTSVFTIIKSTGNTSSDAINEDIASIKGKIPDARAREHVAWKAQPIKEIHLYSQMSGEQGNERILYIYLLVAIAAGLLIIAVVNFTSLTAAEWRNRWKELYVRHVTGSGRKDIVAQFLIETMMMFVLMIPIALAVVYSVLPEFNTLAGKDLVFGEAFTVTNVMAMLVLVLIYFGAAAGSVLGIASRAKKAEIKTAFNRTGFVIVAQSIIAIVVCCFSLTIYKQLIFVESKNKGFETEGIINIPLFSSNFNSIIGQVTGDLRGRMNFFEEQVLKDPSIEAISCSAFKPGEGGVSALVQTETITAEANVFIPLNSVDFDFLDTYEIPLLAGRSFSREYGTDHLNAFIINEQALGTLGFRTAQDAIGKDLSAVGKEGSIIGVVKDFHFEGLQQSIRPLIFEVAAWKFSNFSVRINPDKTAQAIEVLKREWDKVFPETVFKYEFLENDLRENYTMERNLGSLSKVIGVAAVFLALLGVYASSVYKASKEVKSMTVRKVLGANVAHLVKHFLSPYMGMLLASYLIAIPLALFVSEKWLAGFAYRTHLGIADLLVIMLSGISLILIMLLRQMIKLTTLDPVKNLRSE